MYTNDDNGIHLECICGWHKCVGWDASPTDLVIEENKHWHEVFKDADIRPFILTPTGVRCDEAVERKSSLATANKAPRHNDSLEVRGIGSFPRNFR